MPENVDDYEKIVEEVLLRNGLSCKVGFKRGKWIAKTQSNRIAISNNGLLLHFKYDEEGRAHFYELYASFEQMNEDEVNFFDE